jgi:hypothetical protein
MKRQFSEALARRDTLQSEAAVGPSKVNICPVCSKPYGEHSEADLGSCAGKWPKRERGASGLELQREFVEVHFKDEEPDPIKRAKFQAQTLQVLCACGKTVGDHTEDEIMACFHRDGEGNEGKSL